MDEHKKQFGQNVTFNKLSGLHSYLFIYLFIYIVHSETKQLLFLALFMPFKSFEIHVALLSKWPTKRTLLQDTFPN